MKIKNLVFYALYGFTLWDTLAVERIFLKSGESRDIKFVIMENDLKFYNSE